MTANRPSNPLKNLFLASFRILEQPEFDFLVGRFISQILTAYISLERQYRDTYFLKLV